MKGRIKGGGGIRGQDRWYGVGRKGERMNWRGAEETLHKR